VQALERATMGRAMSSSLVPPFSPPGYFSPLPSPRMVRTPLPRLSTFTGAETSLQIAESPSPRTARPQPGPIDVYSVIPAGGSGTRLWPLSRDVWPKFLLDVEGKGSSLLQTTFARLAPLCGEERVLVVTGAGHLDGVRSQLDQLREENLLHEPSPKESMAAIGLAAAILHRRDPEAVLASFAADHVIETVTDDSFAVTVASAVAAACASRDIVTIGIKPTEASTAFGYIQRGGLRQWPKGAEPAAIAFDAETAPAYCVERFKEKPAEAAAAAFVASGEYYWNAGMFVTRASVLLELLEAENKELFDKLTLIASAWDVKEKRDEVLAAVWPTLPKISIDHAIAEPAAARGRMLVIPAPLKWTDVGSFEALAELAAREEAPCAEKHVQVLGDATQVFTQEASGLIVPAGGKMIACLGIDDVVIVDTPHALLVTLASRAQDIKKLVAACKAASPAVA
jgi:mannose-1-phosphate guanylyltransferase